MQARIPLHGAVSIEVVGRQVEQDARRGAEVVHIFELETRHLHHQFFVTSKRAHHRTHRRADVAQHPAGPACRGEQVPHQRGGGGLAVRARDRREGVGQQRVGKLDLAPDRHAMRARSSHQGGFPGHAGALDDQVHSRQLRDVLRPQEQMRPLRAGFARARQFVRGLAIGQHHFASRAEQRARRGQTRAAGAEDQARRPVREPRAAHAPAHLVALPAHSIAV